MICEHLQELERQLIEQGFSEWLRGQTWPRDCREWVYFNCYLPPSAREKLPLDRCVESARGSNAVGTTMRGIGPAYEEKMARRGIRAGDLTDPGLLVEKLSHNAAQANRLLQMLGGEPIDEQQLIDDGFRWADLLASHVTDTTYFLNQAVRQGQRLLLGYERQTFHRQTGSSC